MKIIDVSHPIEAGMITYKGLPGPVITDFLSREASRKNYAPGVEFHIARLEMIANTGTYIDAPFHRYADGKDISELPLERMANLPGLVVRTKDREIKPETFQDYDVRGKAVLVDTGWARYWRTDQYSEKHPYLNGNAARILRDAGAVLVGIDSYNIDNSGDPERPVHSLLLKADIPVVEHLCNLESLPDSEFLFFAVPAPLKGMGTFPVRAFAMIL